MSTERGCDLGAPKEGADLTAEDVAGAKGHVRLVQRGHLHQEAITGRGRGLHTSDHPAAAARIAAQASSALCCLSLGCAQELCSAPVPEGSAPGLGVT